MCCFQPLLSLSINKVMLHFEVKILLKALWLKVRAKFMDRFHCPTTVFLKEKKMIHPTNFFRHY